MTREKAIDILMDAFPGDSFEYEAVEMAIQDIKKQIPTKLTHEATLMSSNTCPCCKNVVDRFTEWRTGQKVRIMVSHCWFCGQALLWE